MRNGRLAPQKIRFGYVVAVAAILTLRATDCFADIITFQQGVDSGFGTYSGTSNVTISTDTPNASDTSQLFIDHSPFTWQSLIKFDDIFGVSAGQIDLGSTITSATLTLDVFNTGSDINRHFMLEDWSESLTWNSALLGGNGFGGIQIDNVEASSAAAGSFSGTTLGANVIDVTADLQAWSSGQDNFGWVLLSAENLDGWGARSASFATAMERPLLTVEFSTAAVPEPSAFACLMVCCGGFVLRRHRRD